MNRRSVLALAAAGAVGTGIAAVGIQAPARAHGTLYTYNRIINNYYDGFSFYTYYENSPTSFSYEAGFYARLQAWADFYWSNVGGPVGAPVQLHTLGVHVNKYISGTNTLSQHAYGKAMDIQFIRARHTTSNSTITVFNANDNNATYWGNVASMEYHFRDVVHRADNQAHWNHVHVDNGISGANNSSFSSSSRSQVRFAQAATTHVWGIGTSIDGGYGNQTKANTSAVLSRIGRSGYLHDSQANWLEFCKATFRQGTGKQWY